MQMLLQDEIIIDSFAGGGGASLGIEIALGRGVDEAVNHDPEAIEMHKANHPHTRHHQTSVWEISPRKISQGRPVGLAWFSPDCKHFSKAKGGKPVDKKIRGLAWIVCWWAASVKPRIIVVENVEEFQTWGPLGKDGKPCPARKGLTFWRWVRRLRELGYVVEWKELKACDYGAPTIRKRLFVVARRDGLPIVWPKATHGPNFSEPYKTAAECIDWSQSCPSIFNRKKPLAENTLRRIARGIQRYVIDSANPFIVSCTQTGGQGAGGVRAITDPLSTIVTKAEQCLVSAFLAKHYTGVTGSELKQPIGTVTTVDHHSLVACHIQRDFGKSLGSGLIEPTGTITAGCGGKTALITSHLTHLRGGESSHGNCSADLRQPTRTITANGLHQAEVRAMLIKYYGTDSNPAINAPLHTITTKDRFGLVTVQGQDYEIADIGMRMLSPRELFRAQGFPDSYKIDMEYKGRQLSKASQVRMVGNSVSPPVAAAIVKANVMSVSISDLSTDDWQPGLFKPGTQLSLFDFEEFVMGA